MPSHGQAMHTCTVIKDTVQSLKNQQNNYVFKRNLDDDSDGARLTSLVIVPDRRRGVLERVCNGFLCSMSATYDGAVLLWQW